MAAGDGVVVVDLGTWARVLVRARPIACCARERVLTE